MPQNNPHSPPITQPTLPIPQENLMGLFRKIASKNRDKPVTFFKGKIKTYGEIEEEVNRLAHVFQDLGIQKGDRIAVILPNCPQFIVSFFAAQSLGAIFTAFSPLYSAHEIRQRLNNAQPKILITLNLFIDKIKKIQNDISVNHIIITSVARELPSIKKYLYKLITATKSSSLSNSLNYTALLKNGASTPINTTIKPEEDVAILQYTGGTTGKPKGAMLTHTNLIAQTVIITYWKTKLPTQPQGQIHMAGALPFSHIFGMTSSFLWPISEAATIYLIPDPRKLEEVMEIVDTQKIHFLNCVPIFFQKIGTHPKLKHYNLSSLLLCISGGESLPKETVEVFEKNTGSLLIEGYGVTEASPVTHINPPTSDERRIGSIGVTLPNIQSKIVNPETGKEITTPDVPGELLIKGPSVMKGYWKNEKETDDIFQDGWLRTGDVAMMDSEGYFKIVDRLKDMIIISGYKVWPNEVEDVLHSHPSILEAAVVGITTTLGTKLKAALVAKPGHEPLSSEELRKYCIQYLAPYKIPKHIEYHNELPRSSVGKILRRKLRSEST
jgi:long-chain acyl-CoA synthetase